MSHCIVIAGEFWFGASGAGVAHGFRKLGWEVGEVDVGEHTITGRTPALRIAARFLHGQSIVSYNAAILRQVESSRPRAFLTVKGSLIRPQTLQAIRRQGVVTVNYYPDYHFDYADLDLETFEHYDLFFTTKSFQVDYLKSLIGEERVRFLHHGYSSLVHRPLQSRVPDEACIADVAYIGNHSPYKQEWLKALVPEIRNTRLLVVGSLWSSEMFAGYPLVKVVPRGIHGDAYVSLIQRARINLSLHSGSHAGTGWADLVSTRTFEIPACKGFMLHIDNPEVRSLFEPDKEIGVFSSNDELAGQIHLYLADPVRRSQMAERAHERCVPTYSYDARADAMADRILDLSTG